MKTTTLALAIASLLLAACKPSESGNATAPASGKPYPLDVCIVSGEKLGSMGEPHVITYEGQQIKFCCEHCVPKFEKEPAKFLAKLK